MRNPWLVLMAGFAAFGLVACAGGGNGASRGQMGDLGGDEPAEGGISDVPNPSAEMASKSGKSMSRLQRGHEVYMLKCGECHNYMLPQVIDEDRWEQKLPKMISHAGLGTVEEQAVMDYVIGVKRLKG